MSDLERLNEAIDWLDHQPHAEAYTAAKELRAYADLLANGERVEWCEEHGASVVASLGGCGAEQPPNCRIVSRLLINPPKDESTCRCTDAECFCRVVDHTGCSDFGGYIQGLGRRLGVLSGDGNDVPSGHPPRRSR